MKGNILLLSVLLIACSDPSSNREKAVASIKQYVEKNFPYPNSYENIQYGKLDSGYEYADTLDIQIENLREAMLAQWQSDSVQKINGLLPDSAVTNKIQEDYLNKLNQFLATPKQKHYYIYDKYRAKNKQGATEENVINYELDSTFKIINAD